MAQRKLAIMLHGLVKLGYINCNKAEAKDKLCLQLKPKLSAPLVYYPSLPRLNSDQNDFVSIEIKTSDFRKILQQILGYMPDVKQVEEKEFTMILENLRNTEKYEKPWLIQFVNDFQQNQDLELRKLPNMFAQSNTVFDLQKKLRLFFINFKFKQSTILVELIAQSWQTRPYARSFKLLNTQRLSYTNQLVRY